MRILGIDPGSAVTGYGLIFSDRGRLSLIDAGAFNLPRGAALPRRLRVAADALRDLLVRHSPDEVCLENIFQHANVRSGLVLAHLRGALMLELARAGHTVHEYTALQVKKAIVGHGHAGKEQVRAMVQRLLPGVSLPRSLDVSDAIAVAICHAHAGASMRRWGQA